MQWWVDTIGVEHAVDSHVDYSSYCSCLGEVVCLHAPTDPAGYESAEP